jgi:hypothetical protein
MTDETLPFVSERDARGEVADLYAEIRATLGLPVVNLIWRHFATVDGGLAWAWTRLRPLYASGAAQLAGARLVAQLDLPDLPRVPAAVLAGLGIGDEDRTTLLAILDSYNRGNALNACALSALLAPPGPSAAPPAGAAPDLPGPQGAVPGVRELGEFSPDVQALVWELNALGQPAQDDVLATLYKHVAPWPGFLALSWALLSPLDEDGRLRAAIAQAGRAARAEGTRLAALTAAVAPCEGTPAVRAAASHFVDKVIGRMIPIAQMLRRAVG